MNLIVMATVVNCIVGSHTGAAVPQALSVLECDTATGAAKIIQEVKGVEGTTYFQFSPDGRWLYSAIGELRGKLKRGVIVRFPYAQGRLGAMERIRELPCETPCHLSLSPDGRRLFTASYSSATVVSMNVDGSDFKTYVFPDDDVGPNPKRQTKAFAHFTFLTPDARWLGAVDLGCDRIRFFDPLTLHPQPDMEIKTDRGDGPRHAVWAKDGRFLFVVNELGSSVSSFAFDGRRFAKVGKWSMLPKNFNCLDADGVTLASKASAIKLTQDGTLLLASNRGHDSIAVFAVDAASGRLALKAINPLKGSFPRDFELVPGERWVVVGHKRSDEIQLYRFDRDSGRLDSVGKPIACWKPLCFRFALDAHSVDLIDYPQLKAR